MTTRQQWLIHHMLAEGTTQAYAAWPKPLNTTTKNETFRTSRNVDKRFGNGGPQSP